MYLLIDRINFINRFRLFESKTIYKTINVNLLKIKYVSK